MTGKEVKVGVELTPNPHSLKFVLDRVLLEFGSLEFPGVKSVQDCLLAARLFEIQGIRKVFIGKNFVTVSKDPSLNWEPLVPPVFHALKSVLESTDAWVSTNLIPAKAQYEGEGLQQKIQEVLDREIRPAVARDGGDILFAGYENGILRLYLQGACSSCPSSLVTLRMGIETRLKELFPEIREVVQM